MIELRCGRWQDVLKDVVECDAVITDPPYLGAAQSVNNTGFAHGRVLTNRKRDPWEGGSLMKYDPATEEMLTSLVSSMVPRASGWSCVFNDFPGCLIIRSSMVSGGMHCPPQPVIWVKPPTLVLPNGNAETTKKSVEFITVCRKKGVTGGRKEKPGHYVSRPLGFAKDNLIAGGKPLPLMRAIIRDYTKPGDLIVDPFAGSGTTLIAARQEGRDCIGAEMDPETYKKAMKRIEKPYTPELF